MKNRIEYSAFVVAIIICTAIWAVGATISNTPSTSGSLNPADKVPLGRYSGAADHLNARTATMAQIDAYANRSTARSSHNHTGTYQPVMANYSCPGGAYMKKFIAATGTWYCSTPEVGTGTVSSVFGRTGAVVPVQSDYSSHYVGKSDTGAVQIPYLSNVTSDVQAQINGKESLFPNRTTLVRFGAGPTYNNLPITNLTDNGMVTPVSGSNRISVVNSVSADYRKVINKEAVKVGIIGDSIAMGYYADGHATYLPLDKDNVLFLSYANQLRAWLKTLNAGSDLNNQSVAAYKTTSHITDDTTGTLVTWGADVVFIALGINDCFGSDDGKGGGTVGQTLAQFSANMQTMIDDLQASGVTVVLVKENAVNDKFTALAPNVVNSITQDNNASYYDQYAYQLAVYYNGEIDRLAAVNGCDVLDLWTPFNNRFEESSFAGTSLMYDAKHPDQSGHDYIYSLFTRYLTRERISDEAYGTGWNGSTDAPTKNAVYDKIETMSVGATPPGGSDTQIQFNNSGSFGGVTGFTFTSGTPLLQYTGNYTLWKREVATPAANTLYGSKVLRIKNTDADTLNDGAGVGFILQGEGSSGTLYQMATYNASHQASGDGKAIIQVWDTGTSALVSPVTATPDLVSVNALQVGTSSAASDVLYSAGTTGTAIWGEIPAPATGKRGGVRSKAATTHQFLTAISSVDGSVSAAQPAMADISDLPVLGSGVYTPTISAASNTDSTPTMTDPQYMRVGNTITMSGTISVDPTAAGLTTFEFTLPYDATQANFTASSELAGTATNYTAAATSPFAAVFGVASSKHGKFGWTAPDGTAATFRFTAVYKFIQ